MNLLVDHFLIFLIAILIDITIGDPPEKIERKEKILGMMYSLMILFIFSFPCLMLLFIQNEILYVLLGSLIFKMTFTIKGLERYGRKVIKAGNLEKKRKAVGKIVSRDVADLDMAHLNSAAVESLAENITDSVISPFFYFSFLGVFGAMFYRVINTLDAVVGYKNTRYIHFGWFSAKTDKVMNYVSERIAACLIRLLSNSRWKNHGKKMFR